MNKGLVWGLVCIFLLGWLANTVVSNIEAGTNELPLVYRIEQPVKGVEQPSPSDWVKLHDIKVYNNRIVIEIENATLAEFADTNSMDPVLDAQSHGIEIIPQSPNQIHVGDVVAYESDIGVIIHRVVEKGTDSEGIYFITKGDNNRYQDPEKVRFEKIKRVLIAVIY